MRRPRLTSAVLLAAAALALAVPACFKPDHPACAFSCVDPPHTCPSGYTCGSDYLCHDPNSPGTCAVQLLDAGSADAADADSARDIGARDESADTDAPGDGSGDR